MILNFVCWSAVQWPNSSSLLLQHSSPLSECDWWRVLKGSIWNHPHRATAGSSGTYHHLRWRPPSIHHHCNFPSLPWLCLEASGEVIWGRVDGQKMLKKGKGTEKVERRYVKSNVGSSQKIDNKNVMKKDQGWEVKEESGGNGKRSRCKERERWVHSGGHCLCSFL